MNASEFPSVPASFSQEFKPLFPLGQIVATPAVIAHFNEHRQSILPLLRRHVSGDWGELCAEDKAENALSVQQGFHSVALYRGWGAHLYHHRSRPFSNNDPLPL